MQALKDAGTDLRDIDPYRVGVVIGSGIGGIYTTEEEMQNYHNKGNNHPPFYDSHVVCFAVSFV